MRLHKIRGGNREELAAGAYTICVGISLGDKWFTPENIAGLVGWSLEHSSGKVVVFPADDIHAINIEVRNRVSAQRAARIAQRMSDEILTAVKQEVGNNFSPQQCARITYATWGDVATDEYQKKVQFLYEQYRGNASFRSVIQNIAKNAVANEQRDFSDTDIEKFGTYLLEELPELTSRVPIKNIRCDAYVYPFDGELQELVEEIQKGERFPEIQEKILDTEPKVFLEVR